MRKHIHILALIIPLSLLSCVAFKEKELVQESPRDDTETSVEVISEPEKGLVIKDVDAVVENIHPTFWKESSTKNKTCRINFFIYIDFINSNIDDIEFCKVFSRFGHSWTINKDKYFNEEKGYIGGYVRWFDNFLSSNGSVIPVSKLRCEVKLKNGVIHEKEFNIPLPGKKDSYGMDFVYTEEYRGRISKAYSKCLSRAVIDEVRKIGDYIRIIFRVNDPNTSNLKIIFLNDNKDFLGETDYLINRYSREIPTFFNYGKEFQTRGEPNLLMIKENEINFKEGSSYTIKNIYSFYIKLFDGLQYFISEDPGEFNYISRSEVFEFY
jgi:hypothetical protein